MLMMVCCIVITTACLSDIKLPNIKLPEKETEDLIEWSYTGPGNPGHWGELDSTYVECSTGQKQSPINMVTEKIKSTDKRNEKVVPIEFYLQPMEVGFINNGHTIQITGINSHNTMTVDGKSYRFKQIHFHHPGEHQFNLSAYPIEIHFVHQTDDGSEYAVLAVMVKPGKENLELKKLWDIFPDVKTDTQIKVASQIDPRELLPNNIRSYRYNGSLTTPPCSEKVHWVILKKAVEWSQEQIDLFAKAFPNNSRPIQYLNDRPILTEPKDAKTEFNNNPNGSPDPSGSPTPKSSTAPTK